MYEKLKMQLEHTKCHLKTNHCNSLPIHSYMLYIVYSIHVWFSWIKYMTLIIEVMREVVLFVGFVSMFCYVYAELGVIQTGIFNNITTLQIIDRTGIKSCARRCLYDRSCFAFNYHSKILVCDLLADDGSTMFRSQADTFFSYISSWTSVSKWNLFFHKFWIDVI